MMNAKKIELFELVYPSYGIKLRGKIYRVEIGAMVSENSEEKNKKEETFWLEKK